MAVPAALAVMGAISAVSSLASGIMNSQSQKEQLKLQQEAFDFIKQQSEENKAMWAQELADFEASFGPIERTLNTYYNDLTADKAIASGMQEIAKSYATAKSELNAELAQRGLSTSGAAAAGLSNLAANRASAEATVRKNAQAEVMAAKNAWLDKGLQQKQQALAGMSNAFGKASNTGMYMANKYGAAASAYGNAASSALSSLGSSIGSIASAGLKYSAMNDSGSGSSVSSGTTSIPSSTASITNPKAMYYDSTTNTIVNPNQDWTMRNWRGGN